MKKLVVALGGLMLAACGGEDGPSILTYQYQGTVSGIGCFSGVLESMPISYSVQLANFVPGAGVTLVDQAGNTWTGTLTSQSSFRVTNAAPNADPRMSIVVSDFTHAGAHVDATAMCVSFRCCTTFSGDVSG